MEIIGQKIIFLCGDKLKSKISKNFTNRKYIDNIGFINVQRLETTLKEEELPYTDIRDNDRQINFFCSPRI